MRSFTFVHMLICQLCYKQLCWLHEKSTRAIIYHAICEIFYINKITKFCIAGGWCCHKNVFFNSCPLFPTPVLTSQFWYFDDLVGFREYFSFKITQIIIAYYTQFIPALAGHLLEMWEILPEKSILTKNSKYNLQIQWQSCKCLQQLKKQGLVQMSWNFRVLNDYRILEQLPALW